MALFNKRPEEKGDKELVEILSSIQTDNDTKGKGIASKPSDSQDDDTGIIGFLGSIFGSAEEKAKATREDMGLAMEELSRRSAEIHALYNMEHGITKSLAPKLPQEGSATDEDTSITSTAIDDAVTKALEESTPATVETETVAPTGGLMSPRLDTKGTKVTKSDSMLYSAEATDLIKGVQGKLTDLGYVPRGIDGSVGPGTRSALRHFQENNDLPVTGEADADTINKLKAAKKTGFTFSNATNGLYENYVTDGIEGAGHHLGAADYRRVGITLEAGIVPDSGLKYKHNENVIELPANRGQRWATLSRAGVTRDNFNADNVITDDVVKSGVARKGYDSDEDFTKAVLTAFQDKAEDRLVELGYGRGDFEADAMKTLGDLAWNAGTDPIGYTSMSPVLVELAKPIADRDTTAMQGLLNTAPTSGGKILGGVMKRRAIQYNWSVPSNNRVVRVESSSSTGTGTYHFADGTTKTISRENGADNQNEEVPQL